MRSTAIGVVCGAVAAVLLGGLPPLGWAFAEKDFASMPSHGMPPQGAAAPAVPQAEGLIALTAQVGENYQQLTIVDPRTRVLSVYHIDAASGEISLKSVRNIHWDLQMMEFNGVRPLPHEIRSMSDTKRREY